jgi:hypothetical protein
MKKTTTKPAAKSPAPAPKAVSASKTSVPAKKTAPVAKPTKAAAKKPTISAVATPVVKAVETKPVATTITAKIDIGFHNALYIRGEGAGLSWDKGALMTCVNDDQWQCVLGESARPIVFKFLVNDLSWSTGEDFSVAPGSNVTLVPKF